MGGCQRMHICMLKIIILQTPQLFDLKILYSYVIEIANYESDLILCNSIIGISSNMSGNHNRNYYTIIRGNTVLKFLNYFICRSHKHLKKTCAEQNYRWAELGQALLGKRYTWPPFSTSWSTKWFIRW